MTQAEKKRIDKMNKGMAERTIDAQRVSGERWAFAWFDGCYWERLWQCLGCSSIQPRDLHNFQA